jgi:PAS domain S-box-containing protein
VDKNSNPDIENSEFIKYTAKHDDSLTVNHNSLFSIYNDKKGFLWIAAFGGGLNKYNQKTGIFKHYTTDEGLPSNTIYGILQADDNSLWMSTNKGISRFIIKKEIFQNFDVNDGLQSNEFNPGAFFKTESGEMFFGGINGFNSFNPKNITKNTDAPNVCFTDLKINNQSVIPGTNSPIFVTMQEAEKIILNHDHKDFTVEFTALHFTAPLKNTFRYKIENYSDEWINIGTRNYVSFQSFPPGKYILHVKAANNAGIENEKPISIKIIIKPPWWKTKWTYVLFLLFIIIIVWQSIELRAKRLRLDKKKLKRKVKERTAEIERQKNEILEINEELIQQKDEILAQSEELELVNTELEKLSIVASETDNVVIILDVNANIEWINHGFYKLYGYNLEELKNNDKANILNIKHDKSVKFHIDKCIFQGKSVVFESEQISVNNKKLYIQTTLTPILDLNQDTKKLIAIETDITRLKDAENKINKHRLELETANNEIKQSIEYAAEIQKALFGNKFEIINKFQEAFIYLVPHSIVSGDFYWYAEIMDYKIIIAADCTGHGVPGAFMTVMGHDFLETIIINDRIYKPDKILTELDKKVSGRLMKQSSGYQVSDGMDISIVTIDSTNKKIFFAGAKNSLVYVRENKLYRIKGSKNTVGGDILRRNYKKEFILHSMIYEENDTFYIHTDGFQDQLGGDHDRKYLAKNFRKLLLSVSNLPLKEQEQYIDNVLKDWKGKNEQTDDVMIIAFKI